MVFSLQEQPKLIYVHIGKKPGLESKKAEKLSAQEMKVKPSAAFNKKIAYNYNDIWYSMELLSTANNFCAKHTTGWPSKNTETASKMLLFPSLLLHAKNVLDKNKIIQYVLCIIIIMQK